MKDLLKIMLILISIILLTSCGKSEADIKYEKEEAERIVKKLKREQTQKSNEKAISDLYLKYGMVKGWDKRDTFTYVLQEIFVDKGKPIVFEGELRDITKLDSTYYLNVKNPNKGKYIAQISINSGKFEELKKQLNLKPSRYTVNGCFIFKVSKIISTYSVQIESTCQLEEENCSSHLEYEYDETSLIFKGDLIEFYIK